ncbi:ADP-heptose:LPS heptosyltransferase [Lentzea atacamensis]|uniref:ADP-heptose:LPS heptosyltransferase n=1 Tax=Lentzea atacamensis TaxID=531938 RepID=A0A316HUT9_9PSEU|nr:glycosyltransferase family 9 protein [Lentzea atacamensis]PWK83727.1 ADP-heptose:LPS heptosyltransferase [Lentzea atacamensis]
MKILVLRALGLGDLLTAVPALRGLRAAFPRAEITLAAPEWLRDAVERIEAVDRLLPTEELAPIGFERPDLAVNLHGKGPQSIDRLLATKPRALITYGDGARSGETRMAVSAWPGERHEVLKWCDLLQRNGIRCDPEDFRLHPVGHRTGWIVIHPGASTGARRWPVDRYAAVARELRAEASPDPLALVVTAGPGEGDLARRIVADPVSGSLAELMDLVATARLVICGDTGVAHVATAYGTPSVLLFGPVSPQLWGPLRGPHRVLWHGEPGDTFADDPSPGLLKITIEEVLDAVGGVLCERSESVSSARATSV